MVIVRSADIKENYKIPLIMGGDVNKNLADRISEPLMPFLSGKFDLKRNYDPPQCTTKYHTTIEAVFSRHFEKTESQLCVLSHLTRSYIYYRRMY